MEPLRDHAPRLANAPAGTNRGALPQCLSPELALADDRQQSLECPFS